MSEGYVVDVALMDRTTAVAAIEIKVTHEVDEKKDKRLSIPFIEVDGFEILQEPQVWKPIKDRFKPKTCAKCLSNFEKFKLKTSKIAKDTNIEIPTSYYRYAPHTCWKCNKEILVFTWPHHKVNDKKPPTKKPIPKTIFNRYSTTAQEKYWVNTCLYCNNIQGDFYLYAEPYGPFFTLGCCYDNHKAFRNDLIRLAYWADYWGRLE